VIGAVGVAGGIALKVNHDIVSITVTLDGTPSPEELKYIQKDIGELFPGSEVTGLTSGSQRRRLNPVKSLAQRCFARINITVPKGGKLGEFLDRVKQKLSQIRRIITEACSVGVKKLVIAAKSICKTIGNSGENPGQPQKTREGTAGISERCRRTYESICKTIREWKRVLYSVLGVVVLSTVMYYIGWPSREPDNAVPTVSKTAGKPAKMFKNRWEFKYGDPKFTTNAAETSIRDIEKAFCGKICQAGGNALDYHCPAKLPKEHLEKLVKHHKGDPKKFISPLEKYGSEVGLYAQICPKKYYTKYAYREPPTGDPTGAYMYQLSGSV